jgi:hypothetical protein
MGNLIRRDQTLAILYRNRYFKINIGREIRDDVGNEIESDFLFNHRQIRREFYNIIDI